VIIGEIEIDFPLSDYRRSLMHFSAQQLIHGGIQKGESIWRPVSLFRHRILQLLGALFEALEGQLE
jgi:hypothetical protein